MHLHLIGIVNLLGGNTINRRGWGYTPVLKLTSIGPAIRGEDFGSMIVIVNT